MEIDDILNDPYPAIEDYGLIGDLSTTAMVGNLGSIDVLCWPRFDSPSVFAAHVDRKRGGRFQILPRLDEPREKKLYLPDTNILLSRFLSEEWIAEVSDFMRIRDETDRRQALVRRAKAVHGDITFRILCDPRFDYARAEKSVRQVSESVIVFEEQGEDGLRLRLTASVPLEIQDGAAVAEFQLKQGEHATFVLDEWSGEEAPDACFPSRAFKQTANFWRDWISRSNYRGRWREQVDRSALSLKLLTSQDYGSIIAAPCFGFPNEIGGERNWDYRFTWIRDASFTVYALMRLGYTEEAAAFMKWLEKHCANAEQDHHLDVMLQINGDPVEGEIDLDHLEGYWNSRPVRVGSSNHQQTQMDIYGELMDSAYLYDKFGTPVSYDSWRRLSHMADVVCEHWREPDSGIWEVRSGDRHFLFSKVMCWVALDRAVRLSRKRSLPGPVDRWKQERDELYGYIHGKLWNEERQAFTQFEGADAMDAAALIMPLVKFISPTDPRWLSTLEAITDDLVTDSLVYRYRVGEAFSDHLDGGEGTFSICSFWYVECVGRQGDLQRARFLFEKMLSYGNQLGLFSEQLGPDGSFLGNVPQAFTHLALISAAFDLNRRLDEQPEATP